MMIDFLIPAPHHLIQCQIGTLRDLVLHKCESFMLVQLRIPRQRHVFDGTKRIKSLSSKDPSADVEVNSKILLVSPLKLKK